MSNPYVIPMPWKNLMLVLGGGVALWILPWLAWPHGTLSTGRDPLRKPPVFRYLRTIQGLEGSAWSPVLMPLPTADGFSKKAAIHEMSQKSSGSVLKPRTLEPLYLEMKPAPVASLTGNAIASLETPGFDPERLNPVVFSRVATGQGTGVQVEVANGLKARNFDAPELRGLTLPTTKLNAIFVTALIEIDRRGGVTHVFLEQPSGIAALDSSLVRGLRAGRGDPGEGPVEGALRIVIWKGDQGEDEQHGH